MCYDTLASGQGTTQRLSAGLKSQAWEGGEACPLPGGGWALCLGTEHHYHLLLRLGTAGIEDRGAGGTSEWVERKWLFMLC